MAATNYIEMHCKSAVNRVQGMPFKWSLNPYRGCVHACHYCYARETHTFLGLNPDGDFERQIFFKRNIAEALDRDLSRPGWTGESIAIGTATDAYQPAEARFRLTRACLEVIHRHRNPFSIVTKSSLIVRDLEMLTHIAALADVRIYFTVTTLDERLWKKLEPGTQPPIVRLKALEMLSSAGISCGVLMAPVIPGLTDSQESIDQVARATAAAGAHSFAALPLRLAPPVKNHFTGFLQRDFPNLLPWYLTRMDGQNLPKPLQEEISRKAQQARERFGLGRRAFGAEPPAQTAQIIQFQQLAIPLPGSDPAPEQSTLRYDPLSA